jgi:hypothetical protein
MYNAEGNGKFSLVYVHNRNSEPDTFDPAGDNPDNFSLDSDGMFGRATVDVMRLRRLPNGDLVGRAKFHMGTERATLTKDLTLDQIDALKQKLKGVCAYGMVFQR